MESKSAIHKMSLSIKYVFWHLAPFLVVSPCAVLSFLSCDKLPLIKVWLVVITTTTVEISVLLFLTPFSSHYRG